MLNMELCSFENSFKTKINPTVSHWSIHIRFSADEHVVRFQLLTFFKWFASILRSGLRETLIFKLVFNSPINLRVMPLSKSNDNSLCTSSSDTTDRNRLTIDYSLCKLSKLMTSVEDVWVIILYDLLEYWYSDFFKSTNGGFK